MRALAWLDELCLKDARAAAWWAARRAFHGGHLTVTEARHIWHNQART